MSPRPRTGQRGRPRTKGERLATPPQLATQARRRKWKRVNVDVRGHTVERLVHVRDVLWHGHLDASWFAHEDFGLRVHASSTSPPGSYAQRTGRLRKRSAR